jgi:TrmH family RNA methyltransferase
MRKITALDNPEVKKIVTLQTSKGRQAHRRFTAEGWRTITTLISGNFRPLAIYITEAAFDTAKETFKDFELTLVSQAVMQKISHGTTPSGVLAVFPLRQERIPQNLESGLVLAQIADPGNMGTLIRTAVAMDIRTIVVVEGVDPWSPKVVQATAGTLALANILRLSWDQVLEIAQNTKLYALVARGGKNIQKIHDHRCLVVVGNEAHGIPEEWISECNEKITIPMPGSAESLNAAIAGSIAAYLVFGRKD